MRATDRDVYVRLTGTEAREIIRCLSICLDDDSVSKADHILSSARASIREAAKRFYRRRQFRDLLSKQAIICKACNDGYAMDGEDYCSACGV